MWKKYMQKANLTPLKTLQRQTCLTSMRNKGNSTKRRNVSIVKRLDTGARSVVSTPIQQKNKPGCSSGSYI
jgi:hypothetical protein